MRGGWREVETATLERVRRDAGIPRAAVSLDGVIISMRAGEYGRDETCSREASCAMLPFHDSDGGHLLFLRIYESRFPG